MKKKISFFKCKVPSIEGKVYIVYSNYINNNMQEEPMYIGQIRINVITNQYIFHPTDIGYGEYSLSKINKFLKRLNREIEGE